jgi:hypothetical protein
VSKPAIHIVDFNPDRRGSLCGHGPAEAETWFSTDSRIAPPHRFVLVRIRRSKRICGLCRRIIMLAREKARGR